MTRWLYRTSGTPHEREGGKGSVDELVLASYHQLRGVGGISTHCDVDRIVFKVVSIDRHVYCASMKDQATTASLKQGSLHTQAPL